MKILIEEYQTDWVNDFLEEKEIIGSTLIDFNPTIEHIGSTSVVGLCSKPTIDILVGLQDEKQLDETIAPMGSQGYTYIRKYEAGMPYRRLYSRLKALTNKEPPAIIDINDEFVRGRVFFPVTNIHIVVQDSPHWHRHLAFRDFLRAHADLRDEYCRLKKRLAQLEFKDTNDYNDSKDSFIKKVELLALVWYNNRNNEEDESD